MGSAADTPTMSTDTAAASTDTSAVSTDTPVPVVCDFADLPDDALNTIYMLLPAYSLRAAAASNTAWLLALRRAALPIRRRASWLHHWTMAGAGASIQRADAAVCTGDGTWHPGGVALASTLHLSTGQDSGFRLVVEDAAPGDLLMGITLLQPDAGPSAASGAGGSGGSVAGSGGAEDGGDGDAGGEGAAGAHAAAAGAVGGVAPLEMGYHFMMGRRFDQDGAIQMSSNAAPGSAGGVAPRSIFYGGRSRRCCFATPTTHSSGPTSDTGRDGRSPGKLAKLRHLGDWVEFSVVGGELRATDHTGHSHVWGARVEDGEIWVPTVAWTGSRASIRLAPGEESEPVDVD